MAPEQKYDHEEFARRGKEWYQAILPTVEAGKYGQYVVINIETGDYELDENEIVAWQRLVARLPDTQAWIERIGYPAGVRLGWRSLGMTIEPLP